MEDEVQEGQSSVASGFLMEMFKMDKITMDQLKTFQQKCQRMEDAIQKTYNNQKLLHFKCKKLKQQYQTESQNLANLVQQEFALQEKMEKLTKQGKQTDQEIEDSEHRIEVLTMELNDIEQEKTDKRMQIQKEEKESRMKFQPEIEKLNLENDHLQDEIQQKMAAIENENKHFSETQEKIEVLNSDNYEKVKQIEDLMAQSSKIKEDPLRIAKNSDMLSNAIDLLKEDRNKLADDTSKKTKILQTQQQDIYQIQTQLDEQQLKINTEQKNIDTNSQQIKKFQIETNKLKNEIHQISLDKVAQELNCKEQQMRMKRIAENLNKLKKMNDNKKKNYKKEEIALQQNVDSINEMQRISEKIVKEENEVKRDIQMLNSVKGKLQDDINIIEGKRRHIVDQTNNRQNEQQVVEKQILDLEKEVQTLQNVESTAQQTIKNLTTMRESMARKASSALAEVRQTHEELKIKELLILDLRKKQQVTHYIMQETEFKLNSFKALYEEVKSARNKYVNLIQNSSQDLAELKERIKIMQNELEILKNESLERDKTLMDYKHIIQLEIHRKDRRYAKLNKLEYQKKQKNEHLSQNQNQIKKLLMITITVEKEMIQLRKQYELACESRNYQGIQLIDRNDELCILYEKLNIQENVLAGGETEIKKIEDDIRMIKIEIGETLRKIDVARQQIELVPILADQIISLKNELEIEKAKERKCAEELENPENDKRWRELEGEDPEQEALESKIQVLEERLNYKKEQLLEKELILDEITSLSEKLRKQAVEGRQSTLELSEKVNDFQARLKDLTRKMMSTISELSMLQANSIKLQQERDGLSELNNKSRERVDQELPPQPETEIEYLRYIRDQKRYAEENAIRQQRDIIERNIPPFATKTTAEHRVNAYMPDDNIGIPKPYGNHAPFKPTVAGTNMRHIRKPQPKKIEI